MITVARTEETRDHLRCTLSTLASLAAESARERAASAHLRPLLATLALRGRPLAKESSHRLLWPECARRGLGLGLAVERARRQRTRRDRRVIEPGCSRVVESASSERGELEHPRQWLGAQWPGFFCWVSCAAQSRQARPEEAQEPKPATAEGCTVAMLPNSSVTQAWSEACGGVYTTPVCGAVNWESCTGIVAIGSPPPPNGAGSQRPHAVAARSAPDRWTRRLRGAASF